MPKIKHGIILTGYTMDEGFNPKDPFRCYICKRKEGDKSIYMSLTDGDVHYEPVKVTMWMAEDQGHEMNYPLCVECVGLIKVFSIMKPFISS